MAENLIEITVTRPDGTQFNLQDRARATKVTKATQKWALNDEDTVSVTVQSPYPQVFDIGDTISVFGRDYKLNRLPKIRKTGAHEFTYDLEFEGIQYDLSRVTYDLTIDTTNNELQDVQGDALTGDLERFMTVLIANANRVFPGKWQLGECPETDGDVTLTFSEGDNCLSALQTFCGEDYFNVEFEIEVVNGVYVINLYDEVGRVLPYTFEYGRGKGLYELTRDNVSSSNIVTRLKVYGSTENITSKYRADRLCLPGKSKGESYIEKEEAVEKYGIFEGRKNFDDVKPTFTGSIEKLGDDIYSFVDTKFPFDIQAKDDDGNTLYLIDGVNAKVHFNTGNLAGYEFEINSYDHGTHTFRLVKQTDDRGDVFPSETSAAFRFWEGDEYKVLDLAYPEEIEAEAEAKLEEKGNEYYDQNSQPKVQYGLSVTPAFLESLVTDAGTYNVFEPGDYIKIVDEDIAVDKAIRITSFERNILDPYDYSLTISDMQTDAGIATRIISDIIEIDKVLRFNNMKDPARARANWRSTRELLEMVFDTEGDYYSEKIKPLSIETTMLAVGAKSMQFILTGTVFEPNYGGDVNVIKMTGGVLSHYTISDSGVVNWNMTGGVISALDSSTAYYIYAKCDRDADYGEFVLSTEQKTVDGDTDAYYFWVGVLNSVDPDLQVRAISLTYGATTINGRMITTGRIQSTDGITYFDLDDGEIGGKIKFVNSSGETKDLAAELDGKRRVFCDTPVPPYDKGDLWYGAEDDEKTGSEDDAGNYLYVTVIRLDNSRYNFNLVDGYVDTNAESVRISGITDGDGWLYQSGMAQLTISVNSGDTRTGFVTVTATFSDGSTMEATLTVIQGTGIELTKKILVCVKAKAEGEAYAWDDWSDDVDYDNTQTVIDGGVVTSGTIQVAGDKDAVLAGMTGKGTADDSVRFWAGDEFSNRESAPFRVLQDGTFQATKGVFAGFLQIPFVAASDIYSLIANTITLDGKYCNLLFSPTATATLTIQMPNGDDPDAYNGMTFNLWLRPRLTKMEGDYIITTENYMWANFTDVSSGLAATVKSIGADGGFIQLIGVSGAWVVSVDNLINETFET